jgi:hypothetical protein
MSKLSTLSKVNILLSFIFLIVGFIKPILVEEFKYRGKIKEVESVVDNIAENQNQNYSIKHKFISVKKSEQPLLDKKFDKVSKTDLKYYDYTVTAELKGFTVVAEPKIEFVRKREVAPKIYTYTQTGDKITKNWSSL